MGLTMQQLGSVMTAKEFAQHYALEQEEALPPGQWRAVGAVLAALANGPLKAPDHGGLWSSLDFAPALWSSEEEAEEPEKELTVEDIMASARMAGMVQ